MDFVLGGPRPISKGEGIEMMHDESFFEHLKDIQTIETSSGPVPVPILYREAS